MEFPRLQAGMVKRYHASFPSLSYEFDSRYPLQILEPVRFRNRSGDKMTQAYGL